jgi:DNA-binding XRE family transcriptional regulator
MEKNTLYKPLLKESSPATSKRVASDRVNAVLGFIAANTRRWRLRRGMTQEGLAELADLDLRFVQRIERGTTNLSVSALIALADALKVEPTALFRVAKLTPARPGRPRKTNPPIGPH